MLEKKIKNCILKWHLLIIIYLHDSVVFDNGDDVLVVSNLFGQSQQLDFRLF